MDFKERYNTIIDRRYSDDAMFEESMTQIRTIPAYLLLSIETICMVVPP